MLTCREALATYAHQGHEMQSLAVIVVFFLARHCMQHRVRLATLVKCGELRCRAVRSISISCRVWEELLLRVTLSEIAAKG